MSKNIASDESDGVDRSEEREKNDATPEQLDEIARLLQIHANSYSGVAKEMKELGIKSIRVTGIRTLFDRALPLINGNASSVSKAFQHEIKKRVFRDRTKPETLDDKADRLADEAMAELEKPPVKPPRKNRKKTGNNTE